MNNIRVQILLAGDQFAPWCKALVLQLLNRIFFRYCRKQERIGFYFLGFTLMVQRDRGRKTYFFAVGLSIGAFLSERTSTTLVQLPPSSKVSNALYEYKKRLADRRVNWDRLSRWIATCSLQEQPATSQLLSPLSFLWNTENISLLVSVLCTILLVSHVRLSTSLPQRDLNFRKGRTFDRGYCLTASWWPWDYLMINYVRFKAFTENMCATISRATSHINVELKFNYGFYFILTRLLAPKCLA